VPDSIRRDVALWAGCVAGALDEQEYVKLLNEAGFEEIDVEPTRVYAAADIGLGGATGAASLDGKFMSAFIRARKPKP
jgi:hypothetical protein